MRKLFTSSALVALALAGASTVAVAQQDAPICLLSGTSGNMSCAYQTMSQCLQTVQGVDSCMVNPEYRTVGSGRQSPQQRDLPPPGLLQSTPDRTR